jgi:tetratricopeptide (TPR) repeat protein
VAAGDYSGAEHGYESAILSNRNNAQYSVDLLTEYALVLQKENKILKAITYYNQALDYSVSSYALRPMDTYPADFRADGSDYNANAMTAVTHIMRALNTLTNYDQRIPLEREEAIAADPQNPIVLHYENEISGLGKKTEYTYALPDPRPKSDDYLVKINP